MALTAMLEVYPSSTFDPGDPRTTVLFEVKRALPVGWFLFFEAGDFKKLASRHDDSDYTVLARDHAGSIDLARARAARIAEHCSPRLRAALLGLVDSVAASGKGTLVLNSHRLESSRDELTAPIKWLESLAKKGLTERLVDSGDDLFDECEGVSFEPDDDALDDEPIKVDLGALHGVTGWPIKAKATQWYEKLANPEPEESAPSEPFEATAVELLEGVWSNPSDEGARRVCADALIERGDPRGELITLQCVPERTLKQERRLEKLLAAHQARFSVPFRGPVTFRQGFADEVRWEATAGDPLIGHAAWGTVRTLDFRGPASLLLHPSLAHLTRVRLSAETVAELPALGAPLPFRSLCLSSAGTAGAWRALASVESFPALVEVAGGDDGGWSKFVLPEGARHLISARPQLHLRLWPLSLEQLQPLSAELHATRVHRWTHPPGANLAGPRFDDGWG